MLRIVTAFSCAIVLLQQISAQPQDLVPVTVKVNTTPSPGGFYLAPNCRLATPPYAPYFMVIGNDGSVLQSKRLAEYPFDSRVLKDGRLGYSVFQSAGTGPRVTSTLYRLDSSLADVDTLRGGNRYPIAMHSFDVLANGNRLIVCQENIKVDMASIVPNGHPAADVQQMLVQEITPDGEVLFQFRTLDHLPITASYEDLTAASLRPFHLNAVFEDFDGNFLMSIRHSSMVIKVNRKTGEVMWILGGKLNQFTFKNENEENACTYFSYQHDIRRLPNGNITLFDNGTQRKPQYSRGVEYKIDEVAKTCELVWEYRHDPDIYTSLQGAMQTLPDGHRVLAWGSGALSGIASFTEVDSNKNVVFEAFLHKDMYPYSVTKHATPPGRASASVFIDEILQGNTYVYDKDGGDTTGLTVEYTSLVSFFYNATEVKLFNYAPLDPVFMGGHYPMLLPVRMEMTQEGMESHHGQFRFTIDPLGITQEQAPLITVYRRDTIGKGAFVKQVTRYNPNSRQIIVDSMSIGEFAFGFNRDTVRDVQPPKLISPTGGKRVLLGSAVTKPGGVVPAGSSHGNTHHFSPQGLGTSHKVVVQGVTDPTFTRDTTVKGDGVTLTFTSPGTYTWYVETSYEPTGRVTAGSTIDTFVVTGAFVEFKRPAANVVWTRDSSYAIGWESNVAGSTKIELVKDGDTVAVVAPNVPATNSGFLWRVPVGVPLGEDYRLRLTVKSGDSTFIVTSDYTVAIREEVSSVKDVPLFSTTIAPNPAGSEVFVGGVDVLTNLRVFDAQGLQVLDLPIQGTGTHFNVENLAPGSYHVILSNGIRTDHRILTIVR